MFANIIKKKQKEFADVVRILIYHKDSSILTKVDLDDDQIFLEPLLSSYFNIDAIENTLPDDLLNELMQAYYTKQKIQLKGLLNQNGIAYLPQHGYFKKNENTPFSKAHKITGTDIEIIEYEIPLLRDVMHSLSSKFPIKDSNLVLDESLFLSNIKPLTVAFDYLKKYFKEYFLLVNLVLKKCVFFKIKTSRGRSLASIEAHGAILFNVYPNSQHNEIHFIDNLGFFSGKIIFTTLFHDTKAIFKDDHLLFIADMNNSITDDRNIFTFFSFLFTNCTAALCLDRSIDFAPLNNKQKEEAKTRIVFYIKKYEGDLKKLKLVLEHYSGIENIFFPDGVFVYKYITDNFTKLYQKWAPELSNYNFLDFHFKMRYEHFAEKNI